ncbi:MAG: hypothetical protein DMG81_09615, partial [Acidobacteria bacterium]
KGIVSCEELGDLVAKACVPGHALGIKHPQESTRIVRFKTSAQLVQHPDGIGLQEGWMWIGISPAISARVLRVQAFGTHKEKHPDDGVPGLPAMSQKRTKQHVEWTRHRLRWAL